MALTKIGSIGINTGIKVAGVTTITTLNSATDTLTIGGPVSIAGTLTYEDVTNVDSVGLITARDGIVVGSGITLSKDGDIFFTGIMTGNGSGLTGVANTDVIFPDKISLGDGTATSGDQINVGLGSDLKFYHDGSNSYIQHGGTGNLITRITKDDGIFRIYGNGDTFIANFVDNGAVQLYHNGTKQCETSANGLAFPSGKGIDFSATADAGNSGSTSSELLDDYEEGTWIPNPHDGSVSYNSNSYTKVGRLVTVVAFLFSFTDTSTNDQVKIGGLPYAAAVNGVACGTVMYQQISETHNTVLYMNGSSQLLQYGGDSGSFTQIRHNELSGSSQMYIFAQYMAAT